MAIADKNILITPNVSGILGNQPNVVFTGADSSIGDSAAITVTARPENSGTLSFTGTAGQLFSITNSLEGTIFAVNDVSGIPSLEIDDAGVIKMAEFNGRVLLGGAIDDSASLLQLSGHMRLNDNSEIKFGDDSDFVIFHNGSNSVIRDQGTGSLFIQTSRLIVEDLGSNKSIDATDGGSVDLYHNGSKQFETTSTGASIRADEDDVGLVVGKAHIGHVVHNDYGAFSHYDMRNSTGGYALLQSAAGQTLLNAASGQDLLFRRNNTTIATFETGGSLTLNHGTTIQDDAAFDSAGAILFDKSDKALEVNSSLYSMHLVDNAKIHFGTGKDMNIVHTGSFGFIDTNFIQIRNTAGTNVSAQFFPGNAVDLKYNNTTRFSTTDSGVNVTGSLRVNNAELSTGASAGFAIAMAIAL